MFIHLFVYDYPVSGQKFFQDPASPVMEGIIDFHHDLTGLLIAIGTFVLWMLYRAVYRYSTRVAREAGALLSTYWNVVDSSFTGVFSVWRRSLRFNKDLNKFDSDVLELQALNVLQQLGVKDADLLEDRQEYSAHLANAFVQSGNLEHVVVSDHDALKAFERNNGFSRLIGRSITHHTALEVIWTIVPALFLLIIAIPSFALLYAMDELVAPVITLKVVGRQWYWQYEYSDHGVDYVYESRILGDASADWSVEPGLIRLLDVDKPVVLPEKVHVRILVTASDVLHSFAIPSLGIKLDACPGRLNQTALYARRIGVFYGQCSEICGVNHAFMPIAIDVVSLDEYVNWYLSHKTI